MSSPPKRPDFVERSVKRPSPGTRSLYVVLRLLVPFATYILLATPFVPDLLARARIPSIQPSTRLIPIDQAYSNLASRLWHPPLRLTLAAVGLSPPRALLLAGSLLACAKQTYWVLCIQNESLSLYNAFYVPLVNAVPELVQALLYFARRTSIAPSHGEGVAYSVAFGAAMFAGGIAVEWLSEEQRARFKENSRNKDKVYNGGLFSLARHINYTGFIAWKSAGFYMSSGWIVGVGATLFFVLFFELQAIPPLDAYCQDRYKEQWTRYKREVPNKLLPSF